MSVRLTSLYGCTFSGSDPIKGSLLYLVSHGKEIEVVLYWIKASWSKST